MVKSQMRIHVFGVLFLQISKVYIVYLIKSKQWLDLYDNSVFRGTHMSPARALSVNRKNKKCIYSKGMTPVQCTFSNTELSECEVTFQYLQN